MNRRLILGAVLAVVTMSATACGGGNDPNVQACESWNSAYNAVTKAASAWVAAGKPAGDSSTADAIESEKRVLDSVVGDASGDVQDSLRLVRRALDDLNDAASNAKASFAAIRACEDAGAEMDS